MQPSYKPNPSVVQQLAQVDMIAAVGPTGVGKTTIMEHSGLPFVVTDVTREPRKGEDNGVDYNFRNDYEQLMQEVENGEFVQYVIFQNGEFYGTKATSYPASGPCTMAIIASAVPTFYALGFRRMQPVYILPPTYDEWMKRVKAHHDKDVPARMVEAKSSLEAGLADTRYHFIVNDDLLYATDIFKKLATGEQADHAAEQAARGVALQLLTQIYIPSPAGM